jgi:hypothetical protein
MIFNEEITALRGLRQEGLRQRRLMASLAITFRDGIYLLGPYRYDRLGDAVSYARLQRAIRK